MHCSSGRKHPPLYMLASPAFLQGTSKRIQRRLRGCACQLRSISRFSGGLADLGQLPVHEGGTQESSTQLGQVKWAFRTRVARRRADLLKGFPLSRVYLEGCPSPSPPWSLRLGAQRVSSPGGSRPWPMADTDPQRAPATSIFTSLQAAGHCQAH